MVEPTETEAKETLAGRFEGLTVATEHVPVREALGRVLTGPVRALRSVPAFHGAAMDGIAVKASDTFGAMAERPVIFAIRRMERAVGGCRLVRSRVR